MELHSRSVILLCVILLVPRYAAAHEDANWRWDGADFACCLITDDGKNATLVGPMSPWRWISVSPSP